MAIDYSLHIGVSRSVEDVAGDFAGRLSLESGARPGDLHRPGLHVHISRNDTEPSPAAELLGLKSAVTVYFMPDYYSEEDDENEYWRTFIDMFAASAQFLEEADVDGFLTRENEDVLMQRLGGRVTLNSTYGNWHVIEPDRNLGVSFEFAPLPPVPW